MHHIVDGHKILNTLFSPGPVGPWTPHNTNGKFTSVINNMISLIDDCWIKCQPQAAYLKHAWVPKKLMRELYFASILFSRFYSLHIIRHTEWSTTEVKGLWHLENRPNKGTMNRKWKDCYKIQSQDAVWVEHVFQMLEFWIRSVEKKQGFSLVRLRSHDSANDILARTKVSQKIWPSSAMT